MKKLFTLFALLLTMIVFGQFTRNYNVVGLKSGENSELRYSKLDTTIYFEGDNISIYSTGLNPLILKVISKVTTGSYNNKKYEQVTVMDKSGEKATLLLFDSIYNGCIIMFDETIMGFRWQN